MKGPLIVALSSGALLAVALGGYLARDELQYRMVKSSLERSLVAPEDDSGLFELYFCGTGTPRHHAERRQPCLLVVAGETTLLFDAGQGALWSMETMQAPWMKLDAIFLSHLHSDHISGLGEVVQNGWVAGRRQALDVFGPPGTVDVIDGYRKVYEADIEERKPAFGYTDTNPYDHLWGRVREMAIEDGDAHEVYAAAGLVVEAFRVDHPRWEHAYGYRIEFGGDLVVFSGDTRATEAMVRHARGADVLVHEAYNQKMMTMAARALDELRLPVDSAVVGRIAAVHTDTLALAEIAERAEVERLVVTHMIPPIPASGIAERLFGEGMRSIYGGDLTLARDGMRIRVSSP